MGDARPICSRGPRFRVQITLDVSVEETEHETFSLTTEGVCNVVHNALIVRDGSDASLSSGLSQIRALLEHDFGHLHTTLDVVDVKAEKTGSVRRAKR